MDLMPNEERKKADWINKFIEDWKIRAAIREIVRKIKNWYFKIWPRQRQVEIMYLWIKINGSPFANRTLPFPIDHDNMPKAPAQTVSGSEQHYLE